MRRPRWRWWCVIPGCPWQGQAADGLDAAEQVEQHMREKHGGQV